MALKFLFKWPGSKQSIAEDMADVFKGPCEGQYIEPFLGTGSVWMERVRRGEVAPERSILADNSRRLIAMYTAVRHDPHAVLKCLDAMPVEDWKDHYYAIRDEFNEPCAGGPEHAARFLWIQGCAFNGLFRVNSKGGHNAPVGSYKKPRMPDPRDLVDVSEALQSVTLICGDFERVIRRARSGDQVYCDPPYYDTFTGYSGAFKIEDQARLAEAAWHAARRGAAVAISNSDHPRLRSDIYPADRGFSIAHEFKITRTIGAKGGKKAGEIVAYINKESAR